MTAAHVIQNVSCENIKLVKTILNNRKEERKTLDVCLTEFRISETEDLAFMQLSDVQLSKFPLKSCRLSEVAFNTQQIANVGGAIKDTS